VEATASREVRDQRPAKRGLRPGGRSEKKVIRDKSPAIPATDGAIDIAQSTAPVCSLNFLSELTIRIAMRAGSLRVLFTLETILISVYAVRDRKKAYE